jgi:Zn-dependent protease with chaperone function
MTADLMPHLSVLFYAATLFLAAWWTLSLMEWPLIRLLRSRPRHRRSALWFLIGVGPLLVAVGVALATLLSAALKGWDAVADHCLHHPGHPHFCLTHGGGLWPSGFWFWIPAAVAFGGVLVAGVRVARQARGLTRSLSTTEGRSGDQGFVVIPSRTPAAFVAGIIRPKAYLTTAALRLLNPRERRIVATHEREHIRRHDPQKLLLLRTAALLFPGFGAVEREWAAAAEIECDLACLRMGASAEEVSLTILKLARSFRTAAVGPALAYSGGPNEVLRERVERLLSPRDPVRFEAAAPILGFALVVMPLLTFTKTHHLLETLVGVLVR